MSPIGGRRAVPTAVLALCAALAGAVPVAADFGYLGLSGVSGDREGQFFDSTGIASDAAGILYVADSGNYRIQKFEAQGAGSDWSLRFLGAWGTFGSGLGQFNKPIDLALDGSGRVFVVDAGFQPGNNARIQRFNSDGSSPIAWGGFGQPGGVAVHGGTVYVTDSGGHRVLKFDSDGNPDPATPQWGSFGSDPGEFKGPTAIATDTAGNVYVLDAGNYRVQKFGPGGGGAPSLEFSVAEGEPNHIIAGLEVDAAGRIYVVSAGCPGCTFRSVRRYDSSGGMIDRVVCSSGSQSIAGATAHPSGDLFVQGSTSVLRFGEGGGACVAPAQGGGPGGTGGPLVFTGRESVTINDGAQFTNDAEPRSADNPDGIELTITRPAGATRVLVSNDGAFLQPSICPPRAEGTRELCAMDVVENGRYPWQLNSSRPRLPKTVYVRFAGAVDSSSQTFTDDIILDESPPTIQSASLAGAGATTAEASAAPKRRFRLRVRARDRVSGVGRMQLARCKRNPGRLRKFRRRLAIRAARPPSYVRVRDRAGNFSKWRRIRGAPTPRACPKRP